MRLSERENEIVRELARREDRSKSNMLRQLIIEALRMRAGLEQPRPMSGFDLYSTLGPADSRPNAGK